jgi:DNA-binding response OmpR family regulator
MATNKILLAEDEVVLGNIVKESLESRGFDVIFCKDGDQAKRQYELHQPELLVLDVMMPKKDGFTLVKEIRQQNKRIPIIFLTAKSRTEDIVEGFGYGANDYLKKPFSIEELIVRIEALLKTNTSTDNSKTELMQIGLYEFNLEKQTLKLGEVQQTLTHREAYLLDALYQYKNTLAERNYILKKLWGNDDFFNARSMDVFISKLRKKLAGDQGVQILNVRGYGYKLVCKE